MELVNDNDSLWRKTAYALSAYPRLDRDLETDVVIIGTGITGLTAALLLKRAGRKVIVLEKNKIGAGATSRTSAHLTNVVDARYSSLVKSFGIGNCRRVARSMMAAIDQIERFQNELSIDCAFKRVPGYFYAESYQDTEIIHQEFQAAKKSGLSVHMEGQIPLPFTTASAFRADYQAQFQPLSYLDGLAREIHGGQSAIYEDSMVTEIRDGRPCIVHAGQHTIRAKDVVLATHIPLGINLLQSELHSYRSFVIAAKVAGSIPDALFWDTAEPYHYTRAFMWEGEQVVIFGGKDHKVGDGSSQESFIKLEDFIRHRFDILSIEAKWSAQFHDPTDGLPFIGKNPFGKNVYLGTGYTGDGLTFGTLAGMMMTNLIVHGHDEYDDLYQPSRLKLAGTQNFLKKNFGVAKYFIGDRIKIKSTNYIEDLANGEGRVIKDGGAYLAVSRDMNGNIKALSAVCSHMKCIVHWNDAEKSWDCPCHASRFNIEGHKMEGPALEGLKTVDWQPS